jgi:hypothetical protein
MNRGLLHKSKLEDFKQWLDSAGYEHRPGRGDYQVLQVKTNYPHGNWQCLFDRDNAMEHYTTPWPLESIVKSFLRSKGGN